MNKRVSLLLGVVFWASNTWCSKTFYSIPTPFLSSSVERQLFNHDQLRDYAIQPWHNFSVTAFGGQSTDSCKIARYFLPDNKTRLRVGELNSNAVNAYDVDVIANYFDVLTGTPPSKAQSGVYYDNIFNVIRSWTFESDLCFKPTHSYGGFGFLYRQHVSSELDRGWWFELALPIMFVKNNMGMTEYVITAGGPHGDDPETSQSFFSTSQDAYAYHNMTEAFNGRAFKYGKIACCAYKRAKWGVPDVEIKVGYTYFRRPGAHLSSYGGVVIGTGNTPDAQYVFENIVGNNGKTGFYLGSQGGIKVWEHAANFLTFEFEAVWNVFLPNLQIRSLDLYGKPWGRYLWVYTGQCTRSDLQPGINTLTKMLNVGHVSTLDLNLASVYNTGHWQAEFGFHTFVRSRESVELCRCWKEEPAVAGIWYSNNNFVGSGRRVSRSNASIGNYREVGNDIKEFKAFPVTANMTEDEVTRRSSDMVKNDAYLPIKRSQIDFDSAAAPAITTNIMYLSLAHGWYDLKYPVMFGLGGGYEWGDGDAAIDQWKAWGKVSIAF